MANIEARVGLANKFQDAFRTIAVDIESLQTRLEYLREIAARIGSNEGFPAEAALVPGIEAYRDRVTAWLDRQRILGLISPEAAAAVEKLIAEVG